MSSENDRFQSLQSQIDALRKHFQRPEKTAPQQVQEKWWRGNLNAIIMTVFTGLLFGSSMLQWSATRDAVKDTHTSFELGTRAWVIAKDAHIKPTKPDAPSHAIVQEGEGLKDSRTPVLSATLINAGRSPALNVAQIFRIEIVDKLPADDYVSPQSQKDQPGSRHVVAPDGVFFANGVLSLTESQFDDVKRGKLFVVFYGDITYADIFKYSRETKYCYFYQWEIEKMSYCPHYNFAD